MADFFLELFIISIMACIAVIFIALTVGVVKEVF